MSMDPGQMVARQIVCEARTWLGTPYLAGASVRGVGADCGGLVAGVLNALGHTVITMTDLSEALVRHAGLLVETGPRPGAILVLARTPGGPGVHLAIQSSPGALIHAHWSQGVVENSLGRWFTRRLIAAYAILPGTNTSAGSPERVSFP